MSRIDDISPRFVGEDRITVTLDPTSDPPFVERPITVNFDYSAADVDGGVVPPLTVKVRPTFGDGTGAIDKTFSGPRPSSFTFRLFGAGRHLIVIKESAHNRWQGRLEIDVQGEEFSQIQTERQ